MRYYVELKNKKTEQPEGQPFGHTSNKAEAIRLAKERAAAMHGHVDFRHHAFEVWSQDNDGGGFLEFSATV